MRILLAVAFVLAGCSVAHVVNERELDGFHFDTNSTCTRHCDIAMQNLTLPGPGGPILSAGTTARLYEPVYKNGYTGEALDYVAVVIFPGGKERAYGILIGKGNGWYPPHGPLGWNGL